LIDSKFQIPDSRLCIARQQPQFVWNLGSGIRNQES
jgi:hypothetical protein